MKTAMRFLFVAMVVVSFVVPAESQCVPSPGTVRTWLAVRDNGSGRDTLWFGFDFQASYGLDVTLCEIELPPPPPAGVFDVRWVNIPGRQGLDTPSGMGQGFKYDYRPFGGTDTFRLKLQPGDAGAPFKFKWSIPGILTIGDSAWLQDEFGGFIFRVRMHVVDSTDLPHPAFSSALVIVFRGATDVNEQDGLPKATQLFQNYPNPFNPATTISFSVGTYGNTSLRVFNSLGQEVAVLVNNKLNAGRHSVEFNADGLPSGVYYYRLVAGEFSETKKLMVLK